jgi:hypothetical protein|tara:strand:+ start:228 stop:1082 length:855 start_codon:yes stop_codon:yes gene_type:complete
MTTREDEAETRRSKRSVDYLLEGESVRANAHLRAFVERHARTLLWRLRWDDNYASWARVNGRKLRKEIAEAMAASDLARSELEEMTREGDERREAVVFDLCSGKGLTAAVCAEAVPDVREVVMIDADDRMVLRHLESEPLVRFRRMDVYEEGVGAMMASARESGARVVLVGVHLCGELSRRAVELFSQHGDVLVLSPCCLVREVRAGKRRNGTFGYGLPRLAKRLGGDSYDLWTKLLASIVPTHVGEGFRVRKRVVTDEHMISEKNRFIVLRREGSSELCKPCP